jgi:hypothetical protein
VSHASAYLGDGQQVLIGLRLWLVQVFSVVLIVIMSQLIDAGYVHVALLVITMQASISYLIICFFQPNLQRSKFDAEPESEQSTIE